MSLFDEMLKEGESLFKNEVALDFSFQPKILKYREKEQKHIAECIKSLFQRRNGKNILLHGRPGIGKTVAIKHIFKELDETTDEIVPIYINCWQKNTSYKVFIEICDAIGYKFTQNKKTEELFKIIKERLNKTSVVFCFDEIDKVEEYDFIYSILEEIYRKTIILISNYKEWMLQLDERIKSRLAPEILDFRAYTKEETKGILEQRRDYAFVNNVWDSDAFNKVIEKASELEDIRTGLHLMKEAGNIAENESKRKISMAHVEKAIQKLDDLSIKQPLELDDEQKFVLNIVKLNSGKKVGELFKIYGASGGKNSYKTFKRNIERLAEGNFLSTKKIDGGTEGSTTLVTFQSVKKLTEF